MSQVKKYKKKELKEKIKELYFIRRNPMEEVGEQLNVSRKTVSRYCELISKELDKEIRERSLNEIIQLRTVAHEKSIKRLWDCYDFANKGVPQAKIIVNIEKLHSSFIDDLQKLGIVPTEPKTPENSVNYGFIAQNLMDYLGEESNNLNSH
jgi:hypothetical protein